MNFQFSLRWLLVGVTLTAIAVASLVDPNMLGPACGERLLRFL